MSGAWHARGIWAARVTHPARRVHVLAACWSSLFTSGGGRTKGVVCFCTLNLELCLYLQFVELASASLFRFAVLARANKMAFLSPPHSPDCASVSGGSAVDKNEVKV